MGTIPSSDEPHDFVPDAPSPAQVEGDARPSLTGGDITDLKRVEGLIRSHLQDLPGGIVAEITNLLATVDGHLSANPPNPVATAEALALIRDQLEKHPECAVAVRLAEATKPVLKSLGESVT